MSRCSVPFCNTDIRKLRKLRRLGDDGLSLHEYPSDLALREAWLQAIARIDPETNAYWIPAESSKVCSLHFLPENFKYFSHPRKILKKIKSNSVPCIFPGYPKYLLQNSGPIKRFDSVESKNAYTLKEIVKNGLKGQKKGEKCINTKKRFLPANADGRINGTYIADIVSKKKHSASDLPPGSSTNSGPERCDSEEFLGSPSIPPIKNVSETDAVPTVEDFESSAPDFQLASTSNLDTEGCDSKEFSDSSVIHPIKNVSKTGAVSTVEGFESCTDKVMKELKSEDSVIHNLEDNTDIFSSVGDIELPSIETNHNSTSLWNSTSYSGNINPIGFRTPANMKNIATPEMNLSLQDKIANKCCSYRDLKYLDNLKHKICKTKISSAGRQIRRYKAQILKLQEEKETMKSVFDMMSEKFESYNIEELEKGIESKDPKALFLKDQLRSFTKKKILWSESSMEFAYTLEESFPRAFKFLRQADIVSLPSPQILSYDIGEIDDDDSDASM